jgi:conjugative relaxase-like TrwC/TraI family protein
MMFINHMKSARAAKDYYTQHIAPGDGRYYTQENATQMKGAWHGRAADMLGLSGEVKKEDFFALSDNEHPQTGERLTPRTKEDRRVLTDITFDAPKSVSLAYELGGDDRILDAFRQSVRETMGEIETEAKTRVRKGGKEEDRVTGNMLWAEHVHRTSRPVDGVPDPQLHAHATVFNATFDEVEDRWKAIQLGDVVRDKGYHQAAFHARFAGKLRELGYGIEKDGTSFRLSGLNRDTVEKFSRRTAIIEAEAERLGITDASAKSQLGRKTREKKNAAPESMAELRKEWNARLTPEERLAIQTARSGLAEGDRQVSPEQAKEYALTHSFERASAVSEKRLKAEALTYAVGSVRPEEVADITQHPEVIPIKRDGQMMTSTKTVLQDEVAMLRFAVDGQRKFRPFAWEVKGEELAGLSAEQRKAAEHVLTSRDTVVGVVGKAGTGKTRMMRATIDAIEASSGQQVFVFAPSSQASRGVLKNEGFANAETLEMLLKSEKLQQQTKGQVLWVDEAGLISTRDMKRLMDVAKAGGNRVILSGDYTQHASVEAGDALRILEQEGGVSLARLTEIRRQTEPGYRKAVQEIAEGSEKAAQKGFDALDRMGSVIEASGEARHGMLVRDYLRAHEDGKSALIIAPTHAEGDRLTGELRSALKERGAIGAEREIVTRRSTGWTQAQKSDIRNYTPGMVVEFHQNARGFTRGDKAVIAQGADGLFLQKEDGTRGALPVDQAKRFDVYRTGTMALGRGDRIRVTKNGEARVEGQKKSTRLNNGDIVTVEGFTKEGDIRLEKGRVLPKGFGHISLGYVDTSYASQGKTVDRVFIAVGDQSLPATNRQQWYVSASRGRELAKLYVEDKGEVRERIAKTGQRLSAVELTGTKVRDPWRVRIAKTLERIRIARFFERRAQAIAQTARRREAISHA